MGPRERRDGRTIVGLGSCEGRWRSGNATQGSSKQRIVRSEQWHRARVAFNERSALINSRSRSRYRGPTIKITVYVGARGCFSLSLSLSPTLRSSLFLSLSLTLSPRWLNGKQLRKLVVRVVAAPYPTTKSCDTIGSGMSVVVVISSCFLVIVFPLSGTSRGGLLSSE